MDESNPDNIKIFTAEEANSLLPDLTRHIIQLHEFRDKLLQDEVEIDALELISGDPQKGASNSLTLKIEEYQKTVTRFYAVIDEIQKTGCFLKDVNLGLIDFYANYHGQMVFLCWKLGEPEVHYWHEIGRGYAYRQPIGDMDLRENDKGTDPPGWLGA